MGHAATTRTAPWHTGSVAGSLSSIAIIPVLPYLLLLPIYLQRARNQDQWIVRVVALAGLPMTWRSYSEMPACPPFTNSDSNMLGWNKHSGELIPVATRLVRYPVLKDGNATRAEHIRSQTVCARAPRRDRQQRADSRNLPPSL